MTRLPANPQDRLLLARAEWLARQQGKHRPQGRTHNGAWKPTGNEHCSCCYAHDNRLDIFEHCCSIEHVAALFGVDPTHLKQALALPERE